VHVLCVYIFQEFWANQHIISEGYCGGILSYLVSYMYSHGFILSKLLFFPCAFWEWSSGCITGPAGRFKPLLDKPVLRQYILNHSFNVKLKLIIDFSYLDYTYYIHRIIQWPEHIYIYISSLAYIGLRKHAWTWSNREKNWIELDWCCFIWPHWDKVLKLLHSSWLACEDHCQRFNHVFCFLPF
jgi:hypothetical protein